MVVNRFLLGLLSARKCTNFLVLTQKKGCINAQSGFGFTFLMHQGRNMINQAAICMISNSNDFGLESHGQGERNK